MGWPMSLGKKCVGKVPGTGKDRIGSISSHCRTLWKNNNMAFMYSEPQSPSESQLVVLDIGFVQ